MATPITPTSAEVLLQRNAKIATFLAVAGISLITVVTLLMVFFTIPDKNISTLNLILGTALGWVTSTYAFFFGNTSGNKSKDDTIAVQAATISSGTGSGTVTPSTTTTTTQTEVKSP